jgi:ABC-2 type transport system ATP-binding protein
MDTPAELIHTYGGQERVSFSADQSLPSEFVNAIRLTGRMEIEGGRVIIQAETSQASFVYDVVSLLANLGIRFRDLRTEQPTLEDVFLKLTGREMKD